MQIGSLQGAYDGLCRESGTTAVPYFLVKYADQGVQVAPLAQWETFFTDRKKVRPVFLFRVYSVIVKEPLSQRRRSKRSTL